MNIFFPHISFVPIEMFIRIFSLTPSQRMKQFSAAISIPS